MYLCHYLSLSVFLSVSLTVSLSLYLSVSLSVSALPCSALLSLVCLSIILLYNYLSLYLSLLLLMFCFLILISLYSRRMWAQGINDWDSWTLSSPMSLWDVWYFFKSIWLYEFVPFHLFHHLLLEVANLFTRHVSQIILLSASSRSSSSQCFPSEAHDDTSTDWSEEFHP